MKKLLFLFALLCISQMSFSQSRFGIRGGLNIASQKQTLSGNNEEVVINGNAFPSFHIGAMNDLALNGHLSIQSTLMLTGKGADFKSLIEGPGGQGTEVRKVRPYYLELPILLVAKTKFPGTSLSVYGGGGPSIACGLFGNEKTDHGNYPLFDNAELQRFDFGIDITVGLELPSGWQISAHYNPGLSNVLKHNYEIPDHHELHNKVFALSVGYFFKNKK